MEKKYILALDQGTTSSRAIVFNKQGEIMGSVQQEFPQIYPHTGWVEHDPIEILGSQVGVISEALIRAKTNADEIAAIGIIVSILNQVLARSGREEQATLTTLTGLIVVLMMVAQKISDLFELVKHLFDL